MTSQRHPSRVTPDGEPRLRQLVDAAAERLCAEPDRVDEAIANLNQLLDRGAEAASFGGETLVVGAVDSSSVEAALRVLCPIFPLC